MTKRGPVSTTVKIGLVENLQLQLLLIIGTRCLRYAAVKTQSGNHFNLNKNSFQTRWALLLAQIIIDNNDS